jgi:uncharacterized membrane protein YphA (DoxX/SURF4 family)
MIRRILQNDYLVLLLRLIVGTVFLFASLEKIVDPAAFALSIDHYRIVPPPFTLWAAMVLPWVELLCGLGLIFGIALRGNALLCSTLMLIFTLAVVSALLRGLDISCGCFTQDPAAARMGWGKAVENTLLLFASLLTFFSSGTRFALDRRTPPAR